MNKLNAAAAVFMPSNMQAKQKSVKAHVKRLTSKALETKQKVTVNILEPEQAECGIALLLGILGLPQLRDVFGMQLVQEALHLDTAQTNRKLAPLGGLIQKTLLAQVMLEAEWNVTPGE